MEYDPKDNEVIHLLKKLKETNGTYPQEMLVSRRQGYLRQVAEISGGAGLAMGLKNTVKGGKGGGLPPVAGKVVETLLVVAIVAEASAVAYFYRHQVAEFFQSLSNEPRVELVSDPPVVSSPIPEIVFTPSPVPTETGTVTPVSTPSLELVADATQQNGGSSSSAGGGSSSAVSTPDPNVDNENNGNQYGLTPKPERTREPGNDTSEGNTQDNNTNPRRKK